MNISDWKGIKGQTYLCSEGFDLNTIKMRFLSLFIFFLVSKGIEFLTKW